jgi:hypothetical protein
LRPDIETLCMDPYLRPVTKKKSSNQSGSISAAGIDPA